MWQKVNSKEPLQFDDVPKIIFAAVTIDETNVNIEMFANVSKLSPETRLLVRRELGMVK